MPCCVTSHIPVCCLQVRGIIPGTNDVRDAKLHIQHFSSNLELPGACRYEIIRKSGQQRDRGQQVSSQSAVGWTR